MPMVRMKRRAIVIGSSPETAWLSVPRAPLAVGAVRMPAGFARSHRGERDINPCGVLQRQQVRCAKYETACVPSPWWFSPQSASHARPGRSWLCHIHPRTKPSAHDGQGRRSRDCAVFGFVMKDSLFSGPTKGTIALISGCDVKAARNRLHLVKFWRRLVAKS